MSNLVNLEDFTFVLLIRIDSIQRLENVLALVKYINKNFHTNINLLECDRHENNIVKKIIGKKATYSFKKDFDPILHRTKWLNHMLQHIKTPFVAIWDVDAIASVSQITQAVAELRKGKCDFVYPYQKLFLDTSEIIKELFFKKLDTKVLERNVTKMKSMYGLDPVGGAFFCKMSSYKESGFENETFYGWGLEDGERYTRWKRLGYNIKRIPGPLFHLSHPRGINSTDELQTHERNMIKAQELLSIYYMTTKNIPIKYENDVDTKNL